jgi:hypothetical protein
LEYILYFLAGNKNGISQEFWDKIYLWRHENSMKKLTVAGILLQCVLLASCGTTLGAIYGLPGPADPEVKMKPKITKAVNTASSELMKDLPQNGKIAVLGSSTGGNSDKQIVLAYFKS